MSEDQRKRYARPVANRAEEFIPASTEEVGIYDLNYLRSQISGGASEAAKEVITLNALLDQVEALSRMNMVPFDLEEDDYVRMRRPSSSSKPHFVHSASLKDLHSYFERFFGDGQRAFRPDNSSKRRAILIGVLESYLNAAVDWRPSSADRHYSSETLEAFQFLVREEGGFIVAALRKFISDYREFYDVSSEWTTSRSNSDAKAFPIPVARRKPVSAPTPPVVQLAVPVVRPVSELSTTEIVASLRAFARFQGSNETAFASPTQYQALLSGEGAAEVKRIDEQAGRRAAMKDALVALFDPNKHISDHDFVRAVLMFKQDRDGDRVERHVEDYELAYFQRSVEFLSNPDNLAAFSLGRDAEFIQAVELLKRLMGGIEEEKQAALAVVSAPRGLGEKLQSFFGDVKNLFFGG